MDARYKVGEVDQINMEQEIMFFSVRYKPWYLEECSSTLATTYSSGTPGLDNSVATVDMDGALRPEHICTVEHTGRKYFL